MRKAICIASCLTLCAAVLVAADEQRPLNVKPGTWQVEYNVKYSGLPPQYEAMIDQMTPQQKAAMGISSPKTSNRCVTQKNLNTSWAEGDNNCRWTVVKSTGSDLDLHGTSCAKGSKDMASDMKVDVNMHAIDSEHVHATLRGTATGNDGSKITMDGTYLGKWLSSTCTTQ
jgi:hypothetical protein